MNRRLAALLLGICTLLACKAEESPAQPTLTREQLMDPETCKDCHPKHYEEWRSSMHAYASKDPVFRAMNEQGQDETDGDLGPFCVKCHAPMAVKEGETTDGKNLDDVPEHLQGITCYFCHNVVDVTGEHNAEITLADDTTMRGGISNPDPVRPKAHGVARSRFLEGANPESSKFCGGCHDIHNDNGVHLERTFEEYRMSAFSRNVPGQQTCTQCHMVGRPGLAAIDPDSDVRMRPVHSHLWPGVDVALTPWPNREEYEKAVACELERKTSKMDPIVVAGGAMVKVTFSNETAHNLPSGASQDRRMWLEVIAFDADDQVMCSINAVPDDEPVIGFNDPVGCAVLDGRSRFFDQIFDEDGLPTHKFWEAAPSDDHDAGYTSGTLPPAFDFTTKHTETLNLLVVGAKRITARLRIRPMDYDVLQELVDADYLAPEVLDEVPTFTIVARSWTDDGSAAGLETQTPSELDCPETFDCVVDPDGPGCSDTTADDAGAP